MRNYSATADAKNVELWIEKIYRKDIHEFHELDKLHELVKEEEIFRVKNDKRDTIIIN